MIYDLGVHTRWGTGPLQQGPFEGESFKEGHVPLVLPGSATDVIKLMFSV